MAQVIRTSLSPDPCCRNRRNLPILIQRHTWPELFAQDDTVAEYERRIAELEQLLGKKEVEIALLKNFLGQRS